MLTIIVFAVHSKLAFSWFAVAFIKGNAISELL